MDKELGALRKQRWNHAFAEQPRSQESSKDNVNRKATIVIEHLIQASDVAHTMQVSHPSLTLQITHKTSTSGRLTNILTPHCSTGMYIANGTPVSFGKCTGPTLTEEPTRTLVRTGTR